MERTHLYIAGSILLLLAALFVIGGAVANSRNATAAPSDSTEYATFSGPTNIFASLQRNSDTVPNSTQQSQGELSASELAEQQSAIQNIISSWEIRPGSSDARTARAQVNQTTTVEKTPEETERDEVRDLLNNLLGPKLSDSMTQANGQNTLDTRADIWLGGYSDAQTTVAAEKESDTQKALRTYGNELGKILKDFDLAQGDQVGTLESFLENRSATSGLKKMTTGYADLSLKIAAIKAPAVVTTIQSGLVSSYALVGELLWNISFATTDEELIERMLTYNKASEAVAKNQVALITLLKAHGVEFQNYEPGSIFSFSSPTQNSF